MFILRVKILLIKKKSKFKSFSFVSNPYLVTMTSNLMQIYRKRFYAQVLLIILIPHNMALNKKIKFKYFCIYTYTLIMNNKVLQIDFLKE